MPKCYQLVGVPGAGKSTWVNSQEWAKDCAYISTDHHVERQAEFEGKTYNEAVSYTHLTLPTNREV